MQLSQKVKAVKKEPMTLGTLKVNSKDCPGVDLNSLGKDSEYEIVAELVSVRKPDTWEISENMLSPTDTLLELRVKSVKICKPESKDKDD